MSERNKKTRFEERVRVERLFLVPINRKFGTHAPLAGMTSAAINSWSQRAMLLFDAGTIKNIELIIIEASRRAALLTDNSRHVFERDATKATDSLVDLVTLLDIELNNIQ